MKLPTFLRRPFGLFCLAWTNAASRLRWLSPGTKTLLRWIGALLAFGLVLFTLSCLGGCQHPTPARIALPSTVAVKRAVAAAGVHADKAALSNARAVAVAQKAVASGIAAGSQDAKDLLADNQATSAELVQIKFQLATANAEVDALTEQLLGKQKEVDAQTARLAYLEPKYEAAVKTIWWYRLWCWGLVALSALILGAVLLAKFTRWGATTLGPYLVDAEHLAAKAAPLVALA